MSDRLVSLVGVLAALTVAPQSASACFGTEGVAANIEKAKQESLKVTGSWHLIRTQTELQSLMVGDVDVPINVQWYFGEVISADETRYQTYHNTEFPSSCPDPARPSSNANGTFYLQLNESGGRYFVYHWEGEEEQPEQNEYREEAE